ncbi:MAG: flap endonuclease-1 [Candidatus Iainarchaeum archaeon]|uniref:Flap endonuclease 1 n=1 Tax=Candidatus Iainarchaeum sp. TaxID=3101447 RepID=A0A497JFT1_9ARCH|nr:MAG: flap endonuclease-1 [Candidatus Diapherotrites archaeon]
MGCAIGEILEREIIDLDFLKGKIIGFDAYNILYQFLSIIRSRDGQPLMDSKGRVTSHLTGLFYRTINLLEKNIKPVFVFDGVPLELKLKTIEKRHLIREEARAEFEKALKEGRLEEAKKFAMRASQLTEEMVENAKELLDAMGIPFLDAKHDAEAQLAYMNKNNSIFGCASQDFDCLLFGAPRLLRYIAITGKRKLPGKNIYVDIEPEMILLEKNLQKLGITQKKLVWIGILIGTDFNEKFPRIGAKTALKLVKECSSFEEIIKKTNYKPEFDYREIEKIFLEPEVVEDYEINFNTPNKEKIFKILVEEHNFSEERVNNAIKRLEKAIMQKGSQSSLKKWF